MPHPDRDGRLCGFLNIEETEMSGSFYRRYFILDSANRKFAYYMDSPLSLPESWRNPVGEIYLQYINKVGDARKMRPKVPHCFVVSVAGRQYFLQAEDDHSMEEWIEALNNASKITVPRHERTYQGTEWHAGDLSQTGYVTEIIGGVVCKMPMQVCGLAYDKLICKLKSHRLKPLHTLPSQIIILDLIFYLFQRKSWKRRYFILHEQGLSYFKAEHDKHAIRTIHTVDILEAKQAEGTNLNRDNLFELITSKRIFYIQCDSPADMQGWIDAVRLAVRTRKLEERKSMQEAEGGQHVEPDLGHTYPDPIWGTKAPHNNFCIDC
ncbi:hypothetical protein C0Q70_09442 [Pomacea canaliculata]|uniref:PH domain-containing protein n=1 Tax=Pomacea canaliculata TaxID=400727 RepID=A0A2T7P9T5_POMCA|nr:hypothetical protein C0Q70_09442 [Pomacea canaliculata]